MLYIVSTPIGNLDDITLRALEVLKSVDMIACEDTRHTKILLDKYNIFSKKSEIINSKSETNLNVPNSKLDSRLRGNDKKGSKGDPLTISKCGAGKPRLISYHQHSGEAKTRQIIDWLTEGKDIAVVTDAGTPGISDPGSMLIKRAVEHKIDIVSVPGPTAFVSALSVSGFDTSEFIFIGFLPHKKGRQTKLREIADEKRTVVLYESVHRIKKLLRELNELMPEGQICITRELTKKFEEIYRGKASDIIREIKEKGEFVIVIDRHGSTADNTLNSTEENKVDLLHSDLSHKIRGIAMQVRKELGSGHKESVYQNLFAEKFTESKIGYEREKSIRIRSKNSGKSLGVYQPDFVVEKKLILELKAVNFFT